MSTTPNPMVREATPEDAQAIQDIYLSVLEEGNTFLGDAETFKTTVEQRADRIAAISESPHSRVFVAEEGGEVVGWLSLSGYDLRKMSHVTSLGMAIAKEHRGLGVGTKLMEVAVEWARLQPNLNKIGLAVFETNQAGISLYNKFGFREEGRQIKEVCLSDGQYIDQFIMGLAL